MFQDKTLLNRLFGWKVAKEAKAEFPFALWADYQEDGQRASATLILRERKYTCQLTKLSPTLVEGRCSCPFHRKEGLLCAHLGLLFLAICDPKERREASCETTTLPQLEKSTSATHTESHSPKKELLKPGQKAPAYRITLPDNLLLLARKSPIPCRVEILPEQKDAEEKSSLLELSEQAQEADQRLAAWFAHLGHDFQAPPSLIFLPEGDVLSSFWLALLEHPRLFWLKAPFTCTEELPLLKCQIQKNTPGNKNTPPQYTLSLPEPLDSLLPWKDGFLETKQATFYPKLRFLEEPSCLSVAQRLSFLQGRPLSLSLEKLAAVAPSLLTYFSAPELRELPELQLQEPPLLLQLHWLGSPQKLLLQAFGSYGETYGSYPLFPGPESNSPPEFHSSTQSLWQRQHTQEKAFTKQLERWGFEFSPQGWFLSSEEKTSAFWFFTRPQQTLDRLFLDSGFALTLEQNISQELAQAWKGFIPLRPQLDFLPTPDGLGQDWLEAQFSFQSPTGESLPTQDVLSLLRSGKKSLSLKQGKTVLLDTERTEDWLALLSESTLTQTQAHHYKLSPQSALSLSAFSPAPPPFLGEKGLPQLEWEEQEDFLHRNCLYTLRPYQKEGVRWLYERLTHAQGALLADDMGLGKTLQTLALFLLLKKNNPLFQERPSLLVVPTSLLFNWQEEIEKAFPSLTLDVLYGKGREEVPIRELGLTTYGLLARDLARHKRTPYALLAFDEASLVKNPKTDAARALQGLEAAYKLALTGTPLENSVSDLWSIFHITLPQLLGSQASFQKHYQAPLQKEPRSPEATQALRRLKLKLNPWILRRTKEEVAPELPPKTTLIHSLELTSQDKTLYQQILTQGHALIDSTRQKQGKEAARFALLTTLLRLRQLCNDARLLPLEEKKLPTSYRSQKMEALLLLLQDLLAGHHKVLIFSQFTSMLHLVSRELKALHAPHLLLEGASQNRAQLLTQFQSPDGPPLFLISLKAGGYGLNLQSADTVIHLDPWWNPAVEAQATDRAYRLGQIHPVHVYKMITRGTVEEKILALQEKKKHLLTATLSSSQALPLASLSEEELQGLL